MKTSNIEFQSSKDQLKINGTLVEVKNSKGAILMLTGSGPADRDETVQAELTHTGKEEKLFKQLAESLAQSGFTTLRYDKRGVLNANGKVTKEIWKSADREHLIADATDAAKYLLQKTNTTPEQLLILGHSEGTVIATETAHQLGGQVRGLLLLGAQARSMKEMLHYQIVESRTARGKRADLEAEFEAAIKTILTTDLPFSPDGKPINWYRQFLEAPANEDRLADIKGQVAIFQGAADPQTPAEELDRFFNKRKKLHVFKYEGLGHGFSPDKNGKPTLGPIDEEVLKDISAMALKFSN